MEAEKDSFVDTAPNIVANRSPDKTVKIEENMSSFVIPTIKEPITPVGKTKDILDSASINAAQVQIMEETVISTISSVSESEREIKIEKNPEPEITIINAKPVRTCMPPPSIPGLPSIVTNSEAVVQDEDQDTTIQKECGTKNTKTVEKIAGKKSNKAAPPLPYKTPTWSGQIMEGYCFEVLKGGVIVGNVELLNKCFVVFGRLECCDVVMEHPSISRYHAVVQYREEGDELHPKGLYVYDLDSTHGTFLNKEQIRARTYYRIQVGHMLKLGGSSRVFLLQGPPDDQENESDLTVTQMKELRRKEEAEKIAKEEKLKMQEKKKEDEGVDWGFGEDAEEDPMAENPFALSTTNEDLYLEDPKKSLRGWFEREGYDLEYKVEEKGFGHFSCRILLPIDTGQSLYAEASVKGKKKEAVALCALEACRILDRYGLFRQSHHEGRKRKHKNWEEDDFYESDEDTYLDRTGTIEKKREMRKKLLNKEVLTYDSLIEKLGDVEEEIASIQDKLQKSSPKVKASHVSRDQDSLEAFMSSIQSGEEMDKKAKSNLKLRLSVLQQEKARLQKLANLAQPTSLPPLIKDVAAAGKKMVMIGSMKGGKKKTRLISSNAKVQPPLTTQKPIVTAGNDEMEVEEDDDEVGRVQEELKAKEVLEAEKAECVSPLIEPSISLTEPKPKIEAKPNDGESQTTNTKQEESDAGSDKVVGPKWSPDEAAAKKRGKKRSGHKLKKDIYDGTNPDYAMWLPPEGQTGDGRTFLNEKFGY